MAATISIGLAPESQAVIARWQEAPRRVVAALDAGMDQLLSEAATYTQVNALSGPSGSGARGKTPVGLRSGDLRQDLTHERVGAPEELRGRVGTTARTAAYARAILGPGTTTITPKRAKSLWIPTADNLTPSGVARFSPRALFDRFGKDKVRYIPGKGGRTYVFVEEGAFKTGARKGLPKGKVMFVLAQRVVIQGTDALAEALEAFGPRGGEILRDQLQGALDG
ncbi:MAG: hypothetical protein AAGF84_03780 [Planctomycetota bacterium]